MGDISLRIKFVILILARRPISLFIFLLQCIVVGLSSICVFLCAVSCIFPAAHAIDVFNYDACNVTEGSSCNCVMHDEAEDIVVPYTVNCNVVYDQLRWFLLAMVLALAIGSLLSLWLVLLIWRSRYGRFHSGLKFYSYNASTPHPWTHHPSNPPHGSPYCQTTEPIPPEEQQATEQPLHSEHTEEQKLNNAREEELQLVENKQGSWWSQRKETVGYASWWSVMPLYHVTTQIQCDFHHQIIPGFQFKKKCCLMRGVFSFETNVWLKKCSWAQFFTGGSIKQEITAHLQAIIVFTSI